MTDIIDLYPPIDPPKLGSVEDTTDCCALPRSLLSFAEVEERLIEAMLVCWRHPDRERGWQTLRSAWPDVLREASAGDYDARGGDLSSSEVALRPASLTRREVGEMEEAFAWLECVEPVERKLIGLVITARARGAAQVPWSRLLRPMGLQRGSDGLRKRYERAIGKVCRTVNGGIAGLLPVNPVNSHD